MDFKKAVTTAARFTTSEGLFARLRMLPANGPHPARVFAQDGQVGVLCDLDAGLDVPNTTIDAKRLLDIVKKGTITKFNMLDFGAVEVEVGASTYKLDDGKQFPTSSYPGFPAIPTAWEAETDWSVVQKTFHAVAKDHDNHSLENVCFRPDGFIVCTDGHRIARVISTNKSKRSGLVPLKLFKNWPSREVMSAFDAGTKTAFFRLGLDEVRMAMLQRDNYPDIQQYLPTTHEGAEAVVPVEHLRKAVARGSSLSPINMVKLEFDGLGTLVVTAWNEAPQTFEVQILCESCDPGWLVVSGKLLQQSLDEITTPNVWLGYGAIENYKQPLRIEAPGDYLELIWPFDPDD